MEKQDFSKDTSVIFCLIWIGMDKNFGNPCRCKNGKWRRLDAYGYHTWHCGFVKFLKPAGFPFKPTEEDLSFGIKFV
jgi:hypothetical protein